MNTEVNSPRKTITLTTQEDEEKDDEVE